MTKRKKGISLKKKGGGGERQRFAVRRTPRKRKFKVTGKTTYMGKGGGANGYEGKKHRRKSFA